MLTPECNNQSELALGVRYLKAPCHACATAKGRGAGCRAAGDSAGAGKPCRFPHPVLRRAQLDSFVPRHQVASCLRSPDSRLGHARANGRAHRYASWVKVIETEDVDAKVFGRDALAVERVDPTGFAKVVGRRVGVKLVGGDRRHVAEQAKRALMHLHHQRVLAPANRAVTGRQLGEIGIDFKPDRAAVAATGIGFT